MARHIRIKTEENNYVHFDYGLNDYTLCGLDTMGDPTLSISVPVETKRRVDCPTCLAVVDYCKQIRLSECKRKFKVSSHKPVQRRTKLRPIT